MRLKNKKGNYFFILVCYFELSFLSIIYLLTCIPYGFMFDIVLHFECIHCSLCKDLVSGESTSTPALTQYTEQEKETEEEG